MKKLLLVFLVLCALLGGVVIVGHLWLKGRFERDTLVAEMENAWDCRVTLGSSHLNILRMPAEVHLKELRLYPRDEEVTKAYDQRAPIDPSLSVISVDEAILHMKIEDLVEKTAAIEKLSLDGVNLNIVIDKKGKNRLADLFKKPRPEVEAPVEPKPDVPVQPKREKPPLHAKDLYIAFRVKEASLTNLKAQIAHQQAKKDIEIRDLALHFRDIDIDPKDLTHHNHCAFEFSSDFTVQDLRENRKVGDIKLTGSGSLKPFDAETGFADPKFDLTLKVAKNSLIGGAPLEEQISKKDREKLEKYNINLANLALGGVLKEDAVFQLEGLDSKVQFTNSLLLSFPQYDIKVLKDSWWNSEIDDHEIKLVLVGDAALTRDILGQASKALEDRLGASLAALAQATVQSTLVNEDGRLIIPLKSQKRLSKPEIRLDNSLGDIQDALKDAGRSLLESLLKK